MHGVGFFLKCCELSRCAFVSWAPKLWMSQNVTQTCMLIQADDTSGVASHMRGIREGRQATH